MDQRASRSVITLVALALAGASGADEVFLRGGGRLTGVVVDRTKDKVVVETGPGLVTLPMARVERVVEGRSALEAYRERAADLATRDAEGWAALARWAEERDLQTQSREAWQRVLAVDPSQPEANAALGRVRVDGEWMGSDEAYRARGYVEFEGRWVTPAEHEALLRERAAEERSRREQREAEARAREAEAVAAAPAADAGGVPVWWGGSGNGYWGGDSYWGGSGYWGGYGSWNSRGFRGDGREGVRGDGREGVRGDGRQSGGSDGRQSIWGAGGQRAQGGGSGVRPTTRPAAPPRPQPRTGGSRASSLASASAGATGGSAAPRR